MSHSHVGGTRGICLDCGCGDEEAKLGCDTMLDDDSFISCLNKEIRMGATKVDIEVSKLVLNPGDSILICVTQKQPVELLACIGERLRHLYPANKVLILQGDGIVLETIPMDKEAFAEAVREVLRQDIRQGS